MVDGEALIKHSLRERRSRVGQALPNMRPGYIQIAQSLELKVPNAEGEEPIVKVIQLPARAFWLLQNCTKSKSMLESKLCVFADDTIEMVPQTY